MRVAKAADRNAMFEASRKPSSLHIRPDRLQIEIRPIAGNPLRRIIDRSELTLGRHGSRRRVTGFVVC